MIIRLQQQHITTVELHLPDVISVLAAMALLAWTTFLAVIIWRGAVPQELAALIGVLTVTYFRSREKRDDNNES